MIAYTEFIDVVVSVFKSFILDLSIMLIETGLFYLIQGCQDIWNGIFQFMFITEVDCFILTDELQDVYSSTFIFQRFRVDNKVS